MGINVNYYSRTPTHYLATSRQKICMPTWQKISNFLILAISKRPHSLYSFQNHRVLGKFKSETGSLAPTEFVGLRAKCIVCTYQTPKLKSGRRELKNPISKNTSVINNFWMSCKLIKLQNVSFERFGEKIILYRLSKLTKHASTRSMINATY